MNLNGLFRQLDQIQAQAQLTVEACKSLRLTIEESIPKQEDPLPEEDGEGNCLHPSEARQAAPSMGHANRFHCGRCRKFSE